MIAYDVYHSPIGEIYVVVSNIGVCKIELFKENWEGFLLNHNLNQDKKVCQDVIKQLDEYFLGIRKTFDLPLDIKGTEFQKRVWDCLINIPYGNTLSYKEVAEKIGNPKAVRAVGLANKANEIPIIIPCHRVIGKNGKLIGYAGDKIWVKEYLLKLEEGRKNGIE